MKGRYTLLLLMPMGELQAQPQLPGLWTAPVIAAPCPQDPDVTIQTYAGWEAYQTIDDTWNGPREPSVCIDLAHPPGSPPEARIDFDQTILPRPVFLRVQLDSASAIPLTPDNEYVIELSGFALSGTTLDFGSDCTEGICSGVMVGVRIPDEIGTGHVLRWYQAGSAFGMFSGPFTVCVPTEYFADNALREVIFKLTPASAAPGQRFRLLSANVTDLTLDGSLVQLHEADLPLYQTGPAEYTFDWSFGYNYLVMYEEPSYPSVDAPSYMDLSPVPNTATPTAVTAVLQAFTGFNFQPFTQLRGGLLLGSDSVHHPLTVVNNGADLCLSSMIVELVWGDGDRYVHNSGHLGFEGAGSCFMFMPGSTLEIPAGSTLHYGVGNRGMLALIDGADLVIGSGGELVMHGTMVIKEAPGVTTPRDQHITLGPGARLSFTPGSHIHNAFSIGGAMRLVVTLDGGSIDISGLSPEDRMKVVVVDLPAEPWSEIVVLGNPAGDELVLSFGVREQGTVRWRAIDLLGRQVLEAQRAVTAGRNQIAIPLHRLRPGEYILEVALNDEKRVVRFVKE